MSKHKFLTIKQELMENIMENPISALANACSVIGVPVALMLFFASNSPAFRTDIPFAILLFCLIFIAVKYYRLKKKAMILDNLFNDGVPMISTIQYVLDSYNRDDFNSIRLNPVTITYNFNCPDKRPNEIYQRIEYKFEGENLGREPVTKHVMRLSKSIFSDFSFIKLSAVDHLNKDADMIISKGESKTNLRQIEVYFDGEGISSRAGRVDFSIWVEWTRLARLKNTENYIIDPQNYSRNVGKIEIVVDTNSTFFKNSTVHIIEADRHTLRKKLVVTTRFEQCEIKRMVVKRSITPKKNKLYLLNIKTPI